MMSSSNARAERQKAIDRADRARDAHQWAQMAASCREALKHGRPDAALLVRYGIALKELNDLASAEIAFRNAIAAEPTKAEAHRRLGDLLNRENRTEAAAAAYRRALTLDASLTETARVVAKIDKDRAASAMTEVDADAVASDDDPRKEPIEKSGLFDAAWYLHRYPEVVATELPALEHYLAFGWAEGREPGPRVDTAGYLERYPEVADAQSNPLLHFLIVGAAQGRSCLTRGYERELILGSALFDAAWYQGRNTDIGAADPLSHYIETGAADGRAPGPLFDAGDYLRRNPGVAAARGDPLLHYLFCGARRGRSVRSVERKAETAFIAASGYFSQSAYRAAYRDVAIGDDDPLDHYLDQGAAEGRTPGPRFDAAAYLARTGDVAAAGANPLLNHLIAGAVRCPIRIPDRDDEKAMVAKSGLFDAVWYGKREGIAGGVDPLDHYLDQPIAEAAPPCPAFDTRDYRARYPEVTRAGFNPLLHYILLGRAEHRMIFGIERGRDRTTIATSGLFDAEWYRHTYSDVAAAGLDPIEHYLDHGADQGRMPGPLFDAADYVERNADVRAAKVNPLLHYLAVGRNEGRPIRSLERRRRRALRVWSGWPAEPG